MKLYRGSNVVVEQPRLLRSDRRLDFGPGFYCTSDYGQASRWATLTTKRRESGRPFVSVYDFNEKVLSSLKVLEFADATLEWLDYVGLNRNGEPADDWDIVIGPVANDSTMPVLKLYFAQIYTAEEAIRRLLPQKLKDQYAFRSPAAIASIQFQEAIEP